MMRLKRPRSVAFVEPECLFERLEERIVLDATVDQVQVDTTNVPEGGQADVNEDSATVVDAHCAAEDAGEATYTLTVDGKPVDTYNSENGDAADIDLATDNFAETGKFTWQPNNLDVGTHAFVITADDGAGDTDDFSFEIVVNNVLPEFDSPFEITFIEDVAGQDFTIQLTQEEQGAQYSFDETDPNVQTLDGWLTLGQDSGILSCTVGEPDDSRVGTYVIDIYVHDGSGSAVGQQYTLIVENAIDFTSANSDTTGEDDPWTYDIQTDAENREGHSMTYWLEGAPSWIDVTDPSSGLLSGTPGVDDVGDTTFTIWARDNVTLEDSSQTFTITVTEENYFYGDTSTSVVEDTELLFDVDTDNERDGGTVEYYFEGGSQVWDGWITIDRDTGVLTANPDNSHVGEYILPIRALSDGTEISEDFTVTVENAQPAFLNVETDVYMTQSSGTQTFDVETDDEGVSPGGGYSIASMVSLGTGLAVDPASVGLVIDADTGIISWDPQNVDVDTYTIVVQFDDGNSPNGTATKEFNLQVTNKVNVFTSQDATTWFEDETNQTFDVNTEEAGDGDITYSLGAGAPPLD